MNSSCGNNEEWLQIINCKDIHGSLFIIVEKLERVLFLTVDDQLIYCYLNKEIYFATIKNNVVENHSFNDEFKLMLLSEKNLYKAIC